MNVTIVKAAGVRNEKHYFQLQLLHMTHKGILFKLYLPPTQAFPCFERMICPCYDYEMTKVY